jgi:acyl-CoA synthetase (AMP-forming)/AMP-acid ligase II
MELYYAVSGMGSVLHTINPRLHADQVVYIADHAEDQVLFFDLTFLPLVEAVAHRVEDHPAFVAMTDRAHMPASKIDGLLCYEDLLEAEDDRFEWPEFSEESAATLCYTSGTTGNPKGVLYSHRSTLLHTYAAALPDSLNCAARDTICRWCRCSTSTPGACPTWRAWSAPSWSSRAPGWTASRCTNCSRPKG